MVHAPKDGAPPGETQGEKKAEPSRKDAAFGCGLTLCLVAIAVIVTLMATGVLGSRQSREAVAEEPAFAWEPPAWLSGFWSSADRQWLVAAEPGIVDVTVTGGGATVSHFIEDTDAGDVFTLWVSIDGNKSTTEWDNTRRAEYPADRVWVAQAIAPDDSVAVELHIRRLSASTIEVTVTIGEDQATARLRRDG